MRLSGYLKYLYGENKPASDGRVFVSHENAMSHSARTQTGLFVAYILGSTTAKYQTNRLMLNQRGIEDYTFYTLVQIIAYSYLW